MAKREYTGQFLNIIFDSIHDPFIIIDRDFRIVRVNQAYSDIKKIPIERLEGQKCHEITKGIDSVCDGCVVDKSFRSTHPSASEKMFISDEGIEEWYEIFTYPVVHEDGSVSHVIEHLRDITDRKRTEEENKRLIHRLDLLSCVDGLTELLNRRTLFDRLKHELERIKRYGSGMSLIFCDLDNFKEINDNFGHHTGDAVLRGIADILRKTLRTSDIIGRYGGDEFMMVLPGTPLKGAAELADRIRLLVEDMKIKTNINKVVQITVSLGVTYYGERIPNLDKLMTRIDSALYASKKAGKNRVYTLS